MNIISLVLDMDYCFDRWTAYKNVAEETVEELKDIATPEDCQAQCQQNAKCQFFTWVQAYKLCNMKTAMGTVTNTDSWIVSAPKYCCGGKWGIYII